jgi:hypothetical protein
MKENLGSRQGTQVEGDSNEGDLSKLLRIPFGLNFDVKEVDEFLVEKIHKKLKYSSVFHLPLVGRVVVVNVILASTL